LLKTVPATPARSRQELTLHVTVSAPLVITKGYAAPEVKATYDRAWELCRELEETPEHFFVLLGLSRFYLVRSEFQTTSELGEQLLRLAHTAQDPTLLLLAYTRQSGNLFFQGKFAQAQSHADQGMTFYDAQQHSGLIFLYGEDPAVSCLTWAATALWHLGYPDQALERIYQALRMAQKVSHPFGLTFSLFWAAFLHQYRGEVQSVQEQTETLLAHARELEALQRVALGTGLRGWVLTAQGRIEEGVGQIQQGMATLQAIGQELGWPYFSALLAAAYSKEGHVTEGMQVLTEALDFTYKTGECMHQAELYRLRGELTLAQSNVQRLESGVEEKQKAKGKS